MKRIAFFLLWALIVCPIHAMSFYDSPDTNLLDFFSKDGATYIIRHQHIEARQVLIPANCTIIFEGGQLQAPITFNKTLLKGDVKLQGSHISGSLKNKIFNAQWLCYANGKQDDAEAINMIFSMSNHAVFPKGTYLLSSFHTPEYPINKPYHLGINHSNLTIKGEEGATLLTRTKAGTLCIYSKPYDIKKSISKIVIDGLTFKVENEDTAFDSHQEHCHTLSFMGVNDAKIRNCIFNNYWGDAICLNHYNDNENTGERSRNMRVVIENNHIDGYKHSNRNGISVISGENVTIKGNTLINCAYGKMPGAIDIEPNSHIFTINNIRIIENRIDACHGNNAAISVVSNKRRGPIHNILIRGNQITNSSRGLEFAVECDDVADNIKVENNYVDENTDPYIFYGHGETKNWTFRKNAFRRKTKIKFGGSIKFNNLKESDNEINKMAWTFMESKPFLILMLIVGLLLARFLWKRDH